jgi:HEAT repeat protein
MFRKNSKNTSPKASAKKHSAIPVHEATVKATPKKVAETPVVAAVKPESKVTPTVAAPVRATTGETIETVCNRAAATSAIAVLRGNDADAARDAAITLGTLKDASAVEPLIEALANTHGFYHSVVRAAAAASLGQLKDARAFEPLLAAVRDPMAETSAEAVRSLTALGDARATGELIEIVRNPTGYFLPIVRLAAVAGLIKLGGLQAKAALAEVASNASEDAVIRETARKV